MVSRIFQFGEIFNCISLITESPISPFTEVIKTCNKLSQEMGWPCFVTHISECFRTQEPPNFTDVSEYFNNISSSSKMQSKIFEAVDSINNQTTKEEFIRRIRLQLMVDVAMKMGMDGIFLASNGTRLAGQLIADVAQGKGNQIHLETVSATPFLQLQTV